MKEDWVWCGEGGGVCILYCICIYNNIIDRSDVDRSPLNFF